jgi:hypothetical protein
MPSLLGTLRRRFTDLGGKIAYETKAKQLIMDDRGRVARVRAVAPDGVVDFSANAVVIAAGGYAASKLILEQFVDPNASAMMVRGTPWATGDGLLMAPEAGAGLVNMAGLLAACRGRQAQRDRRRQPVPGHALLPGDQSRGQALCRRVAGVRRQRRRRFASPDRQRR